MHIMGWRAKFVFILMVYAAGFATAVYFLAPAPDGTSLSTTRDQSQEVIFDQHAFTDSVNAGLHKSIDLTKEVAHQATTMIKQKLEERQARDKSKS